MSSFTRFSYEKLDQFMKKIDGLCKEGLLDRALNHLHMMDTYANPKSYQSLLNCCLRKKALPQGKVVHAHLIMRGYGRDEFILNTLMDLYAKCGRLEDARRIFDEMRKRTLFSWTIMISAYSRSRQPEKALELYQRLNIAPDGHLLATILQVCAKVRFLGLNEGRKIHKQVIARGFEGDSVLVNSLLNMYANFGYMDEARYLFERMERRNLASWTSVIGGHAQIGDSDEALKIFREMLQSGVPLDSRVIVSVLPACLSVRSGSEIHKEAIMIGVQNSCFVGTALIDMYAKCGKVEYARHVFDKMSDRNLLCWTTMIAGYAQNGFAVEALEVFRGMRAAGLRADIKAFACVLPAVAALGCLREGEKIHQEILERNLPFNAVIVSALVDMYAKCGEILKARNIFDEFQERDVVLWNTIISAYSRAGPYSEALKLYCQMKQLGLQATQVTFVGVLSACTKLGALEEGMEIHEDIIRSGIEVNQFMENALVDMYAKCGSLEKAKFVFEKRSKRNVVSWNVMIGACVLHRQTEEALKVLEQMLQSGLRPNHITLAYVLSACCHTGLVGKGREVVESKGDTTNRQCYDIDYYNRLMDLLYQSGCVSEAEALSDKMRIKYRAKLECNGYEPIAEPSNMRCL